MTLLEKIIRVLRGILLPISKPLNNRYQKKIRKKNKNNDFTLLCNTCIGGVISHRLGLQFKSPTVNLWMENEDFFIFLKRFEELKNEKITFFDKAEYPIGTLDNVKIHFNHYQTNEEALQKWNERFERINYKNIYVIVIAHSLNDIDLFLHLKDFHWIKKFVILHPFKKINITNGCYIKPSIIGENKINYLDKDLMGFRRFEKKFDFVKFLNDN